METPQNMSPDPKDITQSNLEYFDSKAFNYDNNSNVQKLTASVVRGLLKEYDFDAEHTCLLDFACGTGQTSRLLAPYVRRIVGVDISPKMVEVYNARVQHQGIPSAEMRAACFDILQDRSDVKLDESIGEKFDVIVCVLAYHHFASIRAVSQRLASFLKAGGVLLVADNINTKSDQTNRSGDGLQDTLAIAQCTVKDIPDLETDELHSHGKTPSNVVPHKFGFTRSQLEEAFTFAGLSDFSFRQRVRAKRGSREMNIFVARGVRPL